MKRFAVGFSLLMLAACANDQAPVSTENVAEDSVLARDVMTAQFDSLGPAEEAPVVYDGFDDVAARSSTARAKARRLAVTKPATIQRSPASPPVAAARVATTPVHAIETAKQASPVVTAKAHRETIVASREGTVPRGSALSLVTAERTCSNRVGHTFSAVLTSRVAGSNGVSIPRGADAVAEITSVDSWGAGIGVRVKSVRFDGRTYPVSSKVGYVVPESAGKNGGACIPERAHIDSEIRESFSVASRN